MMYGASVCMYVCMRSKVTVHPLFIAAFIKKFVFDVRGAVQVVGRDAVRVNRTPSGV
jgi:hypothetical protein